jgi:hypothetical protein
MARRTPRLDLGRRRTRLLYAWAVGVEPAPELLRRAVYLGTLSRLHLAWSLTLRITGCAQPHPARLSARQRTGVRPFARLLVHRRAADAGAARAFAGALPAFPLFDTVYRVHLGQQVPAGLCRVPFARRHVRADADARVGCTASFDWREGPSRGARMGQRRTRGGGWEQQAQGGAEEVIWM